ncbi:MAG: hypothetical protein ABIK91_01410 [Pseudomonadota bacterium]|nr:hypothetical protein [Pseudomonadota bacterium]
MKVNEKNILEEVENTLRAYLQRVPFLEIESLERELMVGDICIDIVATSGLNHPVLSWYEGTEKLLRHCGLMP